LGQSNQNCYCSVTQSCACPALCNPMDYSTPGFPVCPSSTAIAYSNSCPLGWWCHPTILSSVVPFSCLQSFPASGSFLMSWLFASGGQSIGASASASVHWIFNEISPSDEYSGLISFRIDWFDLLAVQRTLKSLVQHHGLKSISSSVFSLIYGSTLTSVHDYWKNNSFDYKDLCWLLSNMLILEPKKIKSICVSIFFPIYLPWSDGVGCQKPKIYSLTVLVVRSPKSRCWEGRSLKALDVHSPPLPPGSQWLPTVPALQLHHQVSASIIITWHPPWLCLCVFTWPSYEDTTVGFRDLISPYLN